MNEPIILPAPRRWPYLIVGAVVGASAVVGLFVLTGSSDDERADAATTGLMLGTAPVGIRDLIEQVDWVAYLGYGTAVEVTSPTDGTVTATTPVGTVLRRGDTVAKIDEVPVIVLYGDVPAWRDLEAGDEGPDVEQLETNLVILGFDPDGDVTIDGVFDADTEDMLETWQEATGLEETGNFSTESVVVVDGPVSVTNAPAVGRPARSGEALAVVSARAVTRTVVAEAGVITDVAVVGTPVEHGTILYATDQLEVRAATGLEPIEGLPTNDGLLRDFVLVPGGQRVAVTYFEPGDLLEVARPVLELSARTLSVVVPVESGSRDEWQAGQPVAVTLPDDSVVGGVVVEVGTVALGGGQGQYPTIDVIIEITEPVDDDLPASEVTVTVDGESVFDALVVPTRALVTLAEGGFAVEKQLPDGNTILIGIETGTFGDGVVEVTSGDLEPGDQLVVPQ